RRGVSNLEGAGNYHVYESLFQNSGEADLSIGNTGYFSIRNCTSIGSAAFFTAAPLNSCGLVTLQGNTVVNPQGGPGQIGDLGPAVLMDNLIEAFGGLAARIEPSAGCVSIGNSYTAEDAVQASPSRLSVDDVVACGSVSVELPRLPPAPSNRDREV